MKTRLFGNILALAIGCFAFSARANQMTLTADAYVTNRPVAATAANFGGALDLMVGPSVSSKTLLQFDLAPLPQGMLPSTISKAVLHVFVNKVVTPGSIDVSDIVTTWSEKVVTFNNAPAQGGFLATVPVTEAKQWLSIDITPLVKVWATTPAMNRGVMITAALSAPNTEIVLDAKENVLTSHAPVLDVEFVAVPGPQGPAGPAGPHGPMGSVGPQGPQGPPGPSALSIFKVVEGSIELPCPNGNCQHQGVTYVTCPTGYMRIGLIKAQVVGTAKRADLRAHNLAPFTLNKADLWNLFPGYTDSRFYPDQYTMGSDTHPPFVANDASKIGVAYHTASDVPLYIRMRGLCMQDSGLLEPTW